MADKFKPTAKMLAMLQAYMLLEPREVPTNVALAMAAGVHRCTVWEWQQNPTFREWWIGEVRKYTSSRVERIWGSMYQAAVGGDVSAAKLYIERFDPDYKPVKKTEQEVTHVLPELESMDGGRRAVEMFESFRRVNTN